MLKEENLKVFENQISINILGILERYRCGNRWNVWNLIKTLYVLLGLAFVML